MAGFADPTWPIPEELEFEMEIGHDDIDEIPKSEADEEEYTVRDFVIPPKEEWEKYGITAVSGIREVYSGLFLLHANLKNRYGAIPAAFLEMLKDARAAGEKVVAYHRRVGRSGILQYAEMLSVNGYTQYDTNPSNEAICYYCGEPLKGHA